MEQILKTGKVTSIELSVIAVERVDDKHAWIETYIIRDGDLAAHMTPSLVAFEDGEWCKDDCNVEQMHGLVRP